MIYVYTFTKEEINYFCEDLLNFFPVSLQDSKIAVMALVELEDKIKDKILQQLFINSLCVSGLRRQYREKIDFNLPDFDYIFDFSFDNKEKKDILAYDLICDANDVLKNNLLEVFQFIDTLKKYRMYKKYGKKYDLKDPLLWNIFVNGLINEKYANYILENSNFVAVPNIGVSGMGELAINFIYKKDFCFVSLFEELAKNENINFCEVSSIDDIPYY